MKGEIIFANLEVATNNAIEQQVPGFAVWTLLQILQGNNVDLTEEIPSDFNLHEVQFNISSRVYQMGIPFSKEGKMFFPKFKFIRPIEVRQKITDYKAVQVFSVPIEYAWKLYNIISIYNATEFTPLKLTLSIFQIKVQFTNRRFYDLYYTIISNGFATDKLDKGNILQIPITIERNGAFFRKHVSLRKILTNDEPTANLEFVATKELMTDFDFFTPSFSELPSFNLDEDIYEVASESVSFRQETNNESIMDLDTFYSDTDFEDKSHIQNILKELQEIVPLVLKGMLAYVVGHEYCLSGEFDDILELPVELAFSTTDDPLVQ